MPIDNAVISPLASAVFKIFSNLRLTSWVLNILAFQNIATRHSISPNISSVLSAMSSGETHFADPINAQTRALPRLLCLHGGGVTAEIFFLQLRVLRSVLSPHFRLVCADGPFFCAPGPGMLPVYAGMGPYRRWLRWLEGEHQEVGDEEAIEEVEYKLREAMEEDDARGGKGEWVGLLGFSQGAKVAASLLYEGQLRLNKSRRERGREELEAGGESRGADQADGMYGGFERDVGKEDVEPMDLSDMPEGFAGAKWKFAVVLAGRAPLVKFSPLSRDSTTMVEAGKISEGGLEFDVESNPDRIILPTLHVHGLQDPGVYLHRRLNEHYTAGNAVEIVEWDGGHRVPLKSDDIRKTAEALLRTAKRAGVLPLDTQLKVRE